MKTPVCDCMQKAYDNKYASNPHYGKPGLVWVERKDKATVSCNGGEHGTVKLQQNFCPQCGMKYTGVNE